MEDAPVLRARLAKADPTLSNALEEAIKIARNEWLPALPTNQGSSNAYPHLRNVGGYLEHIICAFENNTDSRFVSLSPGEMYVVLLAVLLHDYGRLVPRTKKKLGHGYLTKQQLGTHHAELGIHAREVAELIGQIAECHEPKNERTKLKKGIANTIGSLSNTTVDPLGTIRLPLLAGLLALADQMDNSYTRSIPDYLTDAKDGTIGLFRRHIRGVSIDAATRLVKTVLTKDTDDKTHVRSLFTIVAKDKDAKIEVKDKYTLSKSDSFLCSSDNSGKKHSRTSACLAFAKNSPEIKIAWLPDSATGAPDSELIKMLASGALLLSFEPPKEKLDEGCSPVLTSMPKFGPQAIAFGNMWENQKLLQQVGPVLRQYGIAIDCWLVELEGRLFRHDGFPTFEPVVSKKLLEDTASAMWALSTRIFGAATFTYEDVAAYLGDPFVSRVKIACQRVATTVAFRQAAETVSKTEPSKKHLVPWTGTDRWHWPGQQTKDYRCLYVSRDKAITFINDLENPNG